MKKYFCMLIIIIIIASCISNEKPRYDKMKILALIDSLDKSPIDPKIDYRITSQILLKHYFEIPSTFLIDSIVAPWFTKKINDSIKLNWSSALFGSYLGGFIKGYYDNHSKENYPNDGNLYVIRTYYKIKKIDPSLNIPFFDSLNNPIFRKNYEEYIRKDVLDFYEMIKNLRTKD